MKRMNMEFEKKRDLLPAVKLAIRPINVLSPVRMTIPRHEPEIYEKICC